jgi:hypothetical protein
MRWLGDYLVESVVDGKDQEGFNAATRGLSALKAGGDGGTRTGPGGGEGAVERFAVAIPG